MSCASSASCARRRAARVAKSSPPCSPCTPPRPRSTARPGCTRWWRTSLPKRPARARAAATPSSSRAPSPATNAAWRWRQAPARASCRICTPISSPLQPAPSSPQIWIAPALITWSASRSTGSSLSPAPARSPCSSRSRPGSCGKSPRRPRRCWRPVPSSRWGATSTPAASGSRASRSCSPRAASSAGSLPRRRSGPARRERRARCASRTAVRSARACAPTWCSSRRATQPTCPITPGWSTRSSSCRPAACCTISAARPRAAGRSVEALAVVHRVDLFLVLLGGRLALHLHGGSQLPCLLGEVPLEDGEALDGLVGRQGLVELVDDFLHLGLDCRMPRHFRVRGRRAKFFLLGCHAGGLFCFRLHHRHQHRDVLALVADHDHLADQLAHGLERVLDRLRSDVLAARGLDQVLFAIGDLQVSVGIDLADVAGVEPAVLVDHFRRRLGLAEIAAHDVAPSLEDLSVGGDLHFHTGKGPADGAELVLPRQIHAGEGDGLGQPIALE